MEYRAALPRACVVAGACAALMMSVSSDASAAVGRTAGQAGVGASGAAQYTIPIWTPPGTNGLQPRLALSYSSLAGDGLAGIGVALTGLSVISRCNQTIAQGGAAYGVALSTADALCLDGLQLKLTSGTQGVAGSTYQTELETFRRVTAQGSAGSGPAWFEVRSHDGLIYEYGNSADSRIEAYNSASVREWALSRIRDRSGNSIEFVYVEDTTNPNFNTYRPAEIRWTGNSAQGVAPEYKVVIAYEAADRPDVLYGFRYDNRVTSVNGRIREPKRIDRIDVFHQPAGAGATLVRRYDLSYEAAGGAGGRTRLQSVQECAGAAGTDCFPATTFNWTNGTPGWGSEVSTGSTAPGGLPLAMDLNSDGRDDLVWSSNAAPGSGYWQFAIANSSGGFNAAQNTSILNTSYTRAFAIEWDGDGLTDLIVPYSGNTWWVLRSNGNGFNTPLNTGAPAVGHFWFADVNGDGLDDLVRAAGFSCGTESNRTEIYTRVATGFSFGPEILRLVLEGCPQGAAALGHPHYKMRSADKRPDFDGDGREDFMIAIDAVVPGVPGAPHRISARQIFAAAREGGLVNGVTGDWRFGDVNGDGLTDFGYTAGTSFQVRYSVGTGLGAGTSVVLSSQYALATGMLIDWDSDGLDDYIVRRTSPSTVWIARAQSSASFAAPVDSGLPIGNPSATVADFTGDGLDDLIFGDVDAGGALRHRAHSGVKPDLLDRAADGFGVVADFDFAPLSDGSVHTKLSGSAYPTREYAGSRYVVQRYSFSDAAGGTSRVTYSYTGARLHLLGRGFLGFAQRTATDSRNAITAEESFQQDPLEYAFIGLPSTIRTRQSASGPLIRETVLTWAKHVYGSGSGERRFPYVSQSVTRDYEAGGIYNGTHLRTTTIANTVDVWGTPTSVTRTTTEVATGLNAGATHTERTYHSAVTNDSSGNWCLGKPTQTQLIANHSLAGGAQITRSLNTSWDLLNCRPTQQIVEPGNSQLQVTTDFGYDGFGNPSSTAVTGVGMAARTSTTSWGSAGQFPLSHTNPLNQTTHLTWHADRGLPGTVTDPNGLTVSFQYDNFGRKTRESRPEGTATTWSYIDCPAPSHCGDSLLRYYVQKDARNTADASIHDHRQFFDAFDRLRYDEPRLLGGDLGYAVLRYDALGRLTQESAPTFYSAPQLFWTTVSYDLLDRPTRVSRPVSDTDPTPANTNASYNGLGMTVTDALGRSRTQVASAWGVAGAGDRCGRQRHRLRIRRVRQPAQNARHRRQRSRAGLQRARHEDELERSGSGELELR